MRARRLSVRECWVLAGGISDEFEESSSTTDKLTSIFLNNNPREFGIYMLSLCLGVFIDHLGREENRVGHGDSCYHTVMPREYAGRNELISRTLVYLLRHGPGKEGVILDQSG